MKILAQNKVPMLGWSAACLRALACASLIFAASLRAATSLTVGIALGSPGTTASVPMLLQADSSVAAFQADVLFDANSLVSGVPSSAITSPVRIIASSVPSPGVLRVVIYSKDGSPLLGGTVASLPFLLRADASPGARILSLSNVIFANALGARVLPVDLTDGAITIRTTHCSFQLSATGASVPAAGGSRSLTVTSSNVCYWLVRNTNTWITILSSLIGDGTGTVNYSVASNALAAARVGSFTVAGQLFTVTQQGNLCTYSLSSSNGVFTTAGGSNTVAVTTADTCSWTVVNTNTWIAIRSGSNGVGNGLVNLIASRNTKRKLRIGNLLIAGQPYRVIQSDTTRPTVTIVSPRLKTKVFTNASVLLRGTAKDNVEVKRVEYSVNSRTNYHAASGTTNWMASLTLRHGKNTVRVRSVDLAGNISAVVTRVYEYVPFGDRTRPTVVIVSPALGTRVFTNATVMLSGTAKDNRGVARVEYSLNSTTNYQAASGTTNWTAALSLGSGNNTLRVRSVDVADNFSAVVTRVYRHVPPLAAHLAARLASVAPGEGGRFEFRFAVTPGRTYVLQASADLQHWSNVSTNFANSDTLIFNGLFDRTIPQRFFRVVESP